MKHRFRFGFTLIFLMGCATPQNKICTTRVEFAKPSQISFTDNEKLMLCGDPSKESWKDIPASQAEFTVRNYLKQRAYYSPTFTFQNDTLTVDPGPLKLATSLTYEGDPKNFQDIKIRDIVGHPLTSELLDKVENFTLTRLKNMAYACPEVKLQALEETGAITVKIRTGPTYYFLEPKLTDSIGLYEKTMRRFDAFRVNAPYRYEWVKLSSNRAENDGIVVSSQFNFVCPSHPLDTSEPQGLSLTQTILGGDRHLLTIGAGASTEEFPIAELTLKSVRLDDGGANLTISLYGSQRDQKVNVIYTEYLFKNAPRFDLAPNFTVEHDKEVTYNTTHFQVGTPLEYHGDLPNSSWFVSFGPAVSRQFSVDSASDTSLSFFSLLGRLNFTSHNYELYQTDPRAGSVIDFNLNLLSDDVSVHPLATIYKITGSKLVPLNPVDPPQWLLGFRYGVATTNSTERAPTSTRLPPQYFETLGGDQDIRGFGRQELNLGTVGAMTSAYLGTEFRYAKTLALGIEPFLFFDMGALGSEPFDFESPLYYSPGFGIRWSTPFGAIRATLAHGYISKAVPNENSLEHLQLFLSFGKEF
jgi:translocation and assembly module TamA